MYFFFLRCYIYGRHATFNIIRKQKCSKPFSLTIQGRPGISGPKGDTGQKGQKGEIGVVEGVRSFIFKFINKLSNQTRYYKTGI